jgi:GMP synthase-like glutamine amidotransferase
MRVQVLQHVPFEDIGCMTAWLEEAAADVRYTRFFENPALPSVEGLDLVIIMGGPMSVNDEALLSWLKAEKQFVRDVIHGGTAVLGVCLGAQLIASALGARVYRNRQKEIGWFPVERTPGSRGTFIFPEQFTAFHWHGETFDLPRGATRLCRSQASENQAFQIGRNVLGLQFHLEMTPSGVGALIEQCSSELIETPFVQSAHAMQSVPSQAYAEGHALMGNVLSYLTSR